MAAPNIVNVSTITGKNAGVIIPSSNTQNLVANIASSGKVYKINALYVGNINANTGYDITVTLDRSGIGAYRFVSQVTIPARATLDVISKPIYLEEGDTLQVYSTSSLQLEAVCSYEELS